jgi:hypothetical protein
MGDIDSERCKYLEIMAADILIADQYHVLLFVVDYNFVCE